MDTLRKFMFENGHVRGELVEMTHSWQQMQVNHHYPKAVTTLLGEMLAAATLLSANLKFNGSIIMQIHGDGPVQLLVVECDAALHVRATAKLAGDAMIADEASLTDLVHAHGSGRFAITLAPKDKLPGQQAYQGIVPLDGQSIAAVIENYMQRSEQLDTKLWLAADNNVVRGLLLQKLPHESVTAEPDAPLDLWNRTVMLASTLKTQEMLQTDITTLMHRLFWEETIRVFEPQHPAFHCTCSRTRVGNMLKTLGRAEIDSALAEMAKLNIACDFCGKHYEFDPVDCAQLFSSDEPVEAHIPPSDHQQ